MQTRRHSRASQNILADFGHYRDLLIIAAPDALFEPAAQDRSRLASKRNSLQSLAKNPTNTALQQVFEATPTHLGTLNR
jgi:hypothetical protein